jgi:hypothetical protein
VVGSTFICFGAAILTLCRQAVSEEGGYQHRAADQQKLNLA